MRPKDRRAPTELWVGVRLSLCLDLLRVVCGSCVSRCSSVSVISHRALCLTESPTLDPRALLHAYCTIILYR